jgi:hypothetical protein
MVGVLSECARAKETKEALEGDYMDWRITWIDACIYFLIHVILQSM